MFRYKRKKLNNMINGKELMIGDYVDVSGHGNPIELGIVKEIYDGGNEMDITIKDCIIKNCDVIFAENEISPIKLTKEFFLKNGFAKLYRDIHVTRLYYRNNIVLNVNIYPPENDARFGIDGIEINYVHEFQHYLRLVKMSDYANNLKI